MIAGAEAVEMRGVDVRDGRDLLLEAVDLNLAAGQSFAITGPASRARSALLRVVAGLRRPSGGDVRVGGWSVRQRPDRVRRLIGFVAEDSGLAERLTPREHLALVTSLRGLSRIDARAASEAMLELVDLAPFAGVDVTRLSGAQQRRLSLALALVHDPPIVLLDEPFDGVDEAGRAEIGSVLLELRAMGKTLLISTGSPADVAEICEIVAPVENARLTRLSGSDPTTLVWIEVISDVAGALRFLREHPRVADIRSEGGFITFAGVTTPEERSSVVETMVRGGVQLAGFGSTQTAAGGDAR